MGSSHTQKFPRTQDPNLYFKDVEIYDNACSIFGISFLTDTQLQASHYVYLYFKRHFLMCS